MVLALVPRFELQSANRRRAPVLRRGAEPRRYQAFIRIAGVYSPRKWSGHRSAFPGQAIRGGWITKPARKRDSAWYADQEPSGKRPVARVSDAIVGTSSDRIAARGDHRSSGQSQPAVRIIPSKYRRRSSRSSRASSNRSSERTGTPASRRRLRSGGGGVVSAGRA